MHIDVEREGMGAGRHYPRSRDGDRDHAPRVMIPELSLFSSDVCLHSHLFVMQATCTYSLATSMLAKDCFGKRR